jgi:hypothetical protein
LYHTFWGCQGSKREFLFCQEIDCK